MMKLIMKICPDFFPLSLLLVFHLFQKKISPKCPGVTRIYYMKEETWFSGTIYQEKKSRKQFFFLCLQLYKISPQDIYLFVEKSGVTELQSKYLRKTQHFMRKTFAELSRVKKQKCQKKVQIWQATTIRLIEFFSVFHFLPGTQKICC